MDCGEDLRSWYEGPLAAAQRRRFKPMGQAMKIVGREVAVAPTFTVVQP